MSFDWNLNIAERLQQCIGFIMESSLSIVTDMREKVLMIDNYRNQLSDNHKLLPDIYILMTEKIFEGSLVALASKNYKEALSLLGDAYFPIEETKRLCKEGSDQRRDAHVFEEDILHQKCVAESLQACALGDELLNRAVLFDEPLNMDMIWDVIDWYRKAIVLTREREVELEAITHSKLGSLYHRVLKMTHRAKDNFLRSVQLALTLHPRTFDQDEWFKRAKKALDEYQAKFRREEEEKYQKERTKYLEELADDLTKLKEKEKGENVEFLQFVYNNWPPKRDDYKMEALSKTPSHTEQKKAFQKAVIHYHPDKIDVEEHGMKWKVLSEEIVKLLTKKYEGYKGSVSSE